MSPEVARQLVGLAFLTAGALAVFLVWLFRRPAPAGASISLDAAPDEPIAFGYQIAWLAVRSTDPARVAYVARIMDPRPANWETGLEAAIRGHGIFVSPPIEGWVFVTGRQLPEPADAEEQVTVWEPWLQRIADEFSQVHYFGNHRESGFHAWARFVDGRETRAFCCVRQDGELHLDRGTPASVERNWQLRGRPDDCLPDEEDTLRVAAEWGLSPMTLEDRDDPHGAGLLGQFG